MAHIRCCMVSSRAYAGWVQGAHRCDMKLLVFQRAGSVSRSMSPVGVGESTYGLVRTKIVRLQDSRLCLQELTDQK